MAHGIFKDHLESKSFLGAVTVRISDLQPLFEETAARHTAKHGFRTYDILHVASARLLGCDHFFSFNVRAHKLAQIEGLKIAPI